MASLVLGIGTSQGAMLSLPPEDWDEAARADKKTPALAYRGATYSYDALARLRGGAFAELNTAAARRDQWQRCQAALDALAAALDAAAPEVVVVVGAEPNGTAEAEHRPARDLGERIRAAAREERFEIALHPGGGFVAGRLLGGRSAALLRVRFDASALLHTAERCFAFGASLGRAIRGWEADARVAVIGTGGLSHPAIDEELDRRLLEAFAAGDPAPLVREPEAMFRAGMAETKAWIVAAGALDHFGLEMRLVDYVPCCRTAAGTGHAMGFAVWS